jgi:hypothetical protein|tara:strand:+ start:72 stop:746 length:675 start_codon:yes stop_codon:yes gene_type:complete
MSLITTASTWTNEEKPRKRIPTMRKTIKKKKPENDSDEYANDSFSSEPETIEEMKNINEERNSRVNDLLNQMSTATKDDIGGLADFMPLEPPKIQTKRDMQTVEYSKDYNPTVTTYTEASNKYKTPNNQYNADDSNLGKLSNYKDIYKQSLYKPYYSQMGIGSDSNPDKNSKMMDRINYMVHLLEAQQHEKTDNVTEEFILYTFLGVFIIFIVDSFSRSGKYVR